MIRLVLLAFLAVPVLFPSIASAAYLYFDPDGASVHRGDTVTLALRLDVDEDECVNTVDATIRYDESIRAVDVSLGDSILSVWVEDPVIDESAHTIRFAGGLPGGYCGRIPGDPSLTNVLLKVVMRSPGFTIGAGSAPEARVWIDDSSLVYLNDGLGTAVEPRTGAAIISLLPTAGDTPTDSWRTAVQEDTEPPSDFSITLTRDETAFSGNYFIVWSTSDKQSGLDHYEVMEEPFSEWSAFRWGRADAPWVEAESPYVLKDQTLNSTIRVRAIDKAGNVTIATLVPNEALRSISRDRLMSALLIGSFVALLLILIGYGIWKRRSRLALEEHHE